MRRVTMIRTLGAGIGLLALAGCTTLTPDPAPATVRDDRLVSDVKALQEWRQEARLEQESQAREIEQLRKQVSALDAAFREQSQGLRAQMQDLEVGRERDKKFIIDELTRKVLALKTDLVPPPPPAANKSGYEHVVKAGETLTDIAKAYKANVDAIIKANSLKNANSIRVGQKLFIPD